MATFFGTVLFLIVLALDVLAIVDCMRQPLGTGARALWILLIVLLPVLGLLLLLLPGQGGGDGAAHLAVFTRGRTSRAGGGPDRPHGGPECPRAALAFGGFSSGTITADRIRAPAPPRRPRCSCRWR